MERNNSPQVTDSKLFQYWERAGIWLVAALLSLCAWMFLKQESKVEQLEVKVQALQVDKVSRQEMKELEDRLYKQMEGMKGDIIYHINMLREKR